MTRPIAYRAIESEVAKAARRFGCTPSELAIVPESDGGFTVCYMPHMSPANRRVFEWLKSRALPIEAKPVDIATPQISPLQVSYALAAMTRNGVLTTSKRDKNNAVVWTIHNINLPEQWKPR